MATIQYRVTVPNDVAAKLMRRGININSHLMREMVELYLEVKENIPELKLNEVIKLMERMYEDGIIKRAEELSAKLKISKNEMKSVYEIIKEAFKVYEHLVQMNFTDAVETIEVIGKLGEEVAEKIRNSEKYKSLPLAEKEIVSPFIRYFTFNILFKELFIYWIRKNNDKLVDVMIEMFVRRNSNVEELAKIVGL